VFEIERWLEALAASGVDIAAYLGTRPVTARLPWDHIDVGLEDGFLLAEYRKALKGRASPPCGKVAGMLIHHTNLAEAGPDRRKLVCYDCGVACDLTKMREDRLVALRALGATEPAVRVLEVVTTANDGRRLGARRGESRRGRTHQGSRDRARRARAARRTPRRGARVLDVRIRFAKVGRAAFLGHLDLVRLLSRSFRRADLPLACRVVSRPSADQLRAGARPRHPVARRADGCRPRAHGPRRANLDVIDDSTRTELAPTRFAIGSRRCARRHRDRELLDRAAQRASVVNARREEARPRLGKLINAVDIVIRPAADGITTMPRGWRGSPRA